MMIERRLLLSGLVWISVFYSMVRGYHRDRRIDRYKIITWTIFVSIAVVFTLRIQELRSLIDTNFADYPVALLVMQLTVVTGTAAYSLSLKWLAEASPQIYSLHNHHRWLIHAAPIVASLLGVCFLASGSPSFPTQWWMQWLSEGYGMLQCAFVFVPINVRMLQHERVFPMRVKHSAVLVFCATFAVTSAYSVVYIPSLLLSHKSRPEFYQPPPRSLISALCIVVMLVPHRWLEHLLLLRLWYHYLQLRILERQLAQLVPLRREKLVGVHFFHPDYIEIAIYITLINILDHYRDLNLEEPRSRQLYEQITALLSQSPDYDTLVKALCSVTI